MTVQSKRKQKTRNVIGRLIANPTTVGKGFKHDKPEPSADKFCHTETLIQDDSPKQTKTKDSQRHWVVDSRAV